MGQNKKRTPMISPKAKLTKNVLGVFVAIVFISTFGASTANAAECPQIIYDLYFGVSDTLIYIDGQVSALQKFLAEDNEVYPEGLVTGFFGNLTEQAVKRFQAKYGVVSSGSPETTGYGMVGPKTRAKIQEVCGQVAVTPSSASAPTETPSATVQSPTSNSWVMVITNRGVPLPDQAVSFLCGDSTKSSILSWLEREAKKYAKPRPSFDDIVCVKGQTTLGGDLLNDGTGPLNKIGVIKYLEDTLPAVKAAKYITVIHYIPYDLPFSSHAILSKYDFIFIKTPNSPTDFYPPLVLRTYGETLIHELMHKLGAIDKYGTDPTEACLIDPMTGKEYSGYDIMCHNIPKDFGSFVGFVDPEFNDSVISDPTAVEIGWLPKPTSPPVVGLDVSISLTSPSEGAELTAGKTYDIKWRSSKNYSSAKNVYISLDKGGNLSKLEPPRTVLEISRYTPNDGLYSWTIPETLAPGLDYYIYVLCANSRSGVGCAASPVRFSIVAPNCVDKDGSDPYTASYVDFKDSDTGNRRKAYDFCSSSTILNEYICFSGEFAGDNVPCANGCSNGVCLKTSAPAAAPSAQVPNCVDNDGNDPYTASYITLKNADGSVRTLKDFCSSPTVLNEYACTAAGEFLGDNFICPNGCSNGVCLRSGSFLDIPLFNLGNILSAIKQLIGGFTK